MPVTTVTLEFSRHADYCISWTSWLGKMFGYFIPLEACMIT